MKRKRLLTLLTFGFLLPASVAAQSSLRSDVLAIIPASAGEVAFVDLIEVRRSPHYQVLKERVIPARFAYLERFVRSAGINLDTDLDWLAWVLVPPSAQNSNELFLGIVQGRFDRDRAQANFAQAGLAASSYRGQTLYDLSGGDSAPTLSFTFLDISTGVFGVRAGVELLLDARAGETGTLPQNSLLTALVNELNGKSPIWVAMDDYYTRLAFSQLLPELTKFQEFETVTRQLRSATMQLDVDRTAELELKTRFQQAADAQSFAFLLQTALAVQGWQTQTEAPELSAVLTRAEVRSIGDYMRVRMEAREAELQVLLTKQIKLFQ